MGQTPPPPAQPPQPMRHQHLQIIQPHGFWGVLEKKYFVFVPNVCLRSAGTKETC